MKILAIKINSVREEQMGSFTLCAKAFVTIEGDEILKASIIKHTILHPNGEHVDNYEAMLEARAYDLTTYEQREIIDKEVMKLYHLEYGKIPIKNMIGDSIKNKFYKLEGL